MISWPIYLDWLGDHSILLTIFGNYILINQFLKRIKSVKGDEFSKNRELQGYPSLPLLRPPSTIKGH